MVNGHGKTPYIALLRGINVGGHTVKMDRLVGIFSALGLHNVKTVIASGNVYFESAETDEPNLALRLESALKIQLGFNVPTMIRSLAELKALVDQNPFQALAVTAETRLNVTFYPDPVSPSIQIPFRLPDRHFQIPLVGEREVFSVITFTPNQGTGDAMNIIEKEFGKNGTTRNWNTVVKLAQL